MRRPFLTLALTGLLGSLLLSSDAAACCHKKKACAPAPCAMPAPCPPPPVCYEPAPCPPPRKKCGGLFKKKHHGCGHEAPAQVCYGGGY